jgi:SH3-like domain-containing protein
MSESQRELPGNRANKSQLIVSSQEASAVSAINKCEHFFCALIGLHMMGWIESRDKGCKTKSNSFKYGRR